MREQRWGFCNYCQQWNFRYECCGAWLCNPCRREHWKDNHDDRR